MEAKEIKNIINNLTIEGKLPVPYYNSKVISDKQINENRRSVIEENSFSRSLNKKYQQIKVATGNLGILNSKIYDLY